MYDTEEELLPATEENLALVRIEELRLDIKSRALDIFQTVRRMSPQDLERASRGIDLALGIEPDRTVEQRRAEEKASESESGCPVLTAEEFQQALQELQEPSEL